MWTVTTHFCYTSLVFWGNETPPLLSAISNGHERIAELLLAAQADLQQCGWFGRTPLWEASSKGGLGTRWNAGIFWGKIREIYGFFLGKWPRNLGILEMTKKKWRFSWEEFSTLKNEIDVTIKNCIWCSMGINGVYTGIINHASWTWLFLHRTDLDWWIFVGLPCSNLHNIA